MRPFGDFLHMIPSGQCPPAMLERTASSVSPVSSQNFLIRTHLFIFSLSRPRQGRSFAIHSASYVAAKMSGLHGYTSPLTP